MPFLLSSRVIYEPNFVRFILASFPDAAANSSLNSGTGCFHVKADLYSFICPLVCPNGSPGRVYLKKKPNRFLVSEPVRLQAKDGTRTRDIHLGKVELYKVPACIECIHVPSSEADSDKRWLMIL